MNKTLDVVFSALVKQKRGSSDIHIPKKLASFCKRNQRRIMIDRANSVKRANDIFLSSNISAHKFNSGRTVFKINNVKNANLFAALKKRAHKHASDKSASPSYQNHIILTVYAS